MVVKVSLYSIISFLFTPISKAKLNPNPNLILLYIVDSILRPIMSSGNLNPINGSHIVAMPYPGRGHINPMINLCNLLSSKGILVTIVLTEEWLGLIGDSTPGSSNIRLRSIPNVIPSEHNRAANFSAFLDAVFGEMEGPFDELLDRIEEKTSCIVADTFLPWMPAVGIRRGIPVVALSTMVPSMFSLFYHFDVLAARRHFFPQEDLSERGEEIIDYIPGMSPMHLADLPVVLVGKSGSVLKHIVKAYSSSTKAQAILFTSFYDLQPHLINTLRATLPIPIYTIGPSIPHFFLKHPKPDPTLTGHVSVSHWLDTCPQMSVLYVSLGSYLSTSEEQMRELLTGLCDSGFKFLWVARGEALGLQEACGEAGLIVPWCDQLRVLCHSAVGGFLTHCGWNSTMESIFAGVPMLTFPLAADQILNSKLIVEDWKVGLRLKERVGGENVIGRKEIGEKVKRLMDLNVEESKELRRRAKELKETCGRAIEKGGSSDGNIDAFVKDFCTGPM